MRLILTLMVLLSITLSANNLNTCKSCHPTIYNEFEQSYHKKSTVKYDKVHKAVWDKHPSKMEEDYTCAKCHAPEETKDTAHKGITCISCHTIIDIEKHTESNKNIYETKDKTLYSAQKGMEDQKIIYKEKSSMFGLVKDVTGSPYHDIDYTNKNFYTGKICMGCHSHKQNEKKFNVCTTDLAGAKNEKSNCITCHMPQVLGSSTTIRQSKTHAFHGFAGVRNSSELLAKYVDISYQALDNKFEIIVHNKAPHNLLIHPLRIVKLKTVLKRDGKSEELRTHTFMKIIGTDGKPSMPWLATEIVKDNMIKGDEKRSIKFDKALKSGDEIEVVLGYHIVNPKVVKSLGLEDEKELYKFIILKSSYFKIK